MLTPLAVLSNLRHDKTARACVDALIRAGLITPEKAKEATDVLADALRK